MPETIDVEAWHRRIKENTFGNYHREMGYCILTREGAGEAALVHFHNAVLHQPEHPASQWYLVHALAVTGHHDELPTAEAVARTVCPRFAVTGRCYHAMRSAADGDFTVAETLLAEADALAPGDAITQGCRLALRILRDAPLTGFKGPPIDDRDLAMHLAILVKGALQSRSQTLSAEAILALYDWLVLLNPDEDTPDLHLDKAKFLLFAKAAYAEAVKEADASLAGMASAQAYLIRGRSLLLLDGKRLPEALRDIEEAVRLSPDDLEARCQLWPIWTTLGRPEATIADIETTMAGNAVAEPTRIRQRIFLAAAFHTSGRVEEAFTTFRSLVKTGALPPAHFWMLALEHAHRGDFAEAHAQLDRAEGAPSDSWNTACRALIHLAQGRPAEALAAARDAESAAPASPWEVSILAQMLDVHGRAKEAAGLYRRAFQLSPWYLWTQWRNRLFGLDRVEEAYRRLGFTENPAWPRPEGAPR